MIKKLAVGAEVDSYCGRCKLVLNHIVTAMVSDDPRRVKCLTCSSEHNHRMPSTSRSRKSTRRASSSTKTSKNTAASRWSTAIAEWDDQSAKKYSIYDSYFINDWVTHTKFGKGIVIDVPAPDRIITLFESGEKMLMHGRKRA